MPPQTRRITKEENRSLRSKKVQPVKNVQISLTRCDKKNSSRCNKPAKKNIVKSNRKSLTPSNSPKSNDKQNQLSLVANTKIKSTKHEEKSVDKKRIAVINDIRKSKSKPSSPSPKSVIKGEQSPKKPAALAKLEQSPKKPAPLEIIKQSPNKKTTTNKETSKSEIGIRKPLLRKASKLRKQMKLGRIYINPTFPLRSVLKKQIHSGDKEVNQGQFVRINSTTEVLEQNNNNISSYIQPKIVLRKIDVQTDKPIRAMRKILRPL